MDFNEIQESTSVDDNQMQAPRKYYSNKIDMSGISQALRDQARSNLRNSRSKGGRTPHPQFCSASQEGRVTGSPHLTPLLNTQRRGKPPAATIPPHTQTQAEPPTHGSTPLETEMTLPTPANIEREKLLRSKPIRDLTFEDFIIDNSSEGTSLLVSFLVREISTIHDDMTDFQLA
jgi:hypothetical protein